MMRMMERRAQYVINYYDSDTVHVNILPCTVTLR